MKTLKQIPCGDVRFEELRSGSFAYVDKTRYIEELENCGARFALIVRPRGQDFEKNFSGTYIGAHRTAFAGSHYVLSFDFSGISSGNVSDHFVSAVRAGISDFLARYPIPGLKALIEKEHASPVKLISEFFSLFRVEGKKGIYVIIDEYDQFANELLAQDRERFRAVASSEGVLRDFYARLKAATANGLVSRIFITGVTTISLDSLTSGFNIAKNISEFPAFAGMFGFTDAELGQLIAEVLVCLAIKKSSVWSLRIPQFGH